MHADQAQNFSLGPSGNEDQSAKINLSSIFMLNQNSSHEEVGSAHPS